MNAGWEAFRAALASGEPLALPMALLGGLLMGLNPCCLAFYPAVAASCCASAATERNAIVLKSAAAFALGTALVTSVLGLLAALAGHAVLLFGRWPRYAIALIPLLMGTHLLGWLILPIPQVAGGWKGRGVAGALLAGLLVPVVIGGCGTPVLAAILSYAAYQEDLAFGALLLFLYGLGSGLPVLAVGAGVGGLAHWAARAGWRLWVEPIAGALLVGLGFYLVVTAP